MARHGKRKKCTHKLKQFRQFGQFTDTISHRLARWFSSTHRHHVAQVGPLIQLHAVAGMGGGGRGRGGCHAAARGEGDGAGVLGVAAVAERAGL